MITFDSLIPDLTERKALSVASRRKMGLRMKKTTCKQTGETSYY